MDGTKEDMEGTAMFSFQHPSDSYTEHHPTTPWKGKGRFWINITGSLAVLFLSSTFVEDKFCLVSRESRLETHQRRFSAWVLSECATVYHQVQFLYIYIYISLQSYVTYTVLGVCKHSGSLSASAIILWQKKKNHFLGPK